MKKPNVIFLDIDGVLHPAGEAWTCPDTGKTMGDRLFRWLPVLISYLDKYPEVEVVIHSSWRFCHPTFEELLSELPLKLRARTVASTGTEIAGRWQSVQDYISKNDIENFIILDDEPSAFGYEGRPEQLIPCRGTKGLADPQVQTKLKVALSKMHST
jgi:hypothetical protein